jgi:hypothetical protein
MAAAGGGGKAAIAEQGGLVGGRRVQRVYQDRIKIISGSRVGVAV